MTAYGMVQWIAVIGGIALLWMPVAIGFKVLGTVAILVSVFSLLVME